MPIYDPQVRAQFRRAAYPPPTGPRSRRSSLDTTGHKKLPFSQNVTPAGGSTRKRRSSLAPAQWLNTSPSKMYEKLHGKGPVNKSDNKDTSELGAGGGTTDPNHNQGRRQEEPTLYPSARDLPDIGLPPTGELQRPPLHRPSWERGLLPPGDPTPETPLLVLPSQAIPDIKICPGEEYYYPFDRYVPFYIEPG